MSGTWTLVHLPCPVYKTTVQQGQGRSRRPFQKVWAEDPNQPRQTQEVTGRQDLMQGSKEEGGGEGTDQSAAAEQTQELNCTPKCLWFKKEVGQLLEGSQLP